MNLALDLDGTLITCEPRQSAVLQAALASLGLRADLSQAWELKRNGASTAQALVQLGFDTALAGRVSEVWQRAIEEPVWLGLDSAPGYVSEVLHNMRAAGARLWLITARSRREWVPQQLARLGLSESLQHVTVVQAQGAATSKSAVLHKISPVAFFGDTESDWHASMAANVPFFAVATGQRSSTFLEGIGIGVVHRDLAAAWEAFISESASKSAA